jgi:hypothetical protein
MTWEFVSTNITVPANAASMRIALRLIQVPPAGTVYLSNVKLADLNVNKDFFVTDFKTDFEPWNDSQKLFEHFSFGSGGRILNDWRQAKVGEACFLANGSNEPMQYPFWIYKIKVRDKQSYVFEADYKTSNGIASNSNAMLLFYFKDRDNNILRCEYLFVAGSREEWKSAKLVMVAPEGTSFLDICLNLRNIAPVDKLYIDNIRFYSEGSRAFLKFSINPKDKKLKSSCSVTSDIPAEDIKSSSIVISKDNIEKCRVKTSLNVESETDIAAWEDGEYSIFSIAETKSGKILKSDIKTFNIFNKTPWLNNKIGILPESAPPPVPWTKFSFDKDSVITWNNRITFANNLQIKSINYSNDKFELLSAPMQFLVNGKDIFAQAQNAPAKYDVKPHEISSAANIKGDGFDLQINTRTDYTGLVKYELILKATRNIELNQARLLLAVNGVEFLNHADGSWTYSRAFDLAKDKQWKDSRFFPVIWVGDMKHGLYWFCEKIYPAKENMPKDWIFADSAGNLAIDIVNEPLKIAAGKTYSIVFGLGMTPSRPDRKLWRELRFRGEAFSNFENLWAMPEFFKHFGFPEASGERAVLMDTFVKSSPNLKKVFYQCPTYIATNLPQWSFFEQAWEAKPPSRYEKIEGLDYDAVKGNYKEQTWTDLYLQSYVAFMKKYKFDGVYHDCAGVDSLLDGKDFTYPVFVLRDFLQRIYVVQRQLNPDSITVTHVGANFSCPSVAFSDIILMGEHYRQGCFDKTYYLEFIPLRLFRAENATSIGAERMFMFQYQQTDKQQNPAIALHAMGLVMCHNLMVYPGFINQQIVDRVRNLQYTFGMTDAEFFPYWEKNPYGIETDNPGVICSFYKNSKGLLLCVLNSTNQEQSFKLKIKDLGTDMPVLQNLKMVIYEPLKDKKSVIGAGASIKLKPYMAAFMVIEK